MNKTVKNEIGTILISLYFLTVSEVKTSMTTIIENDDFTPLQDFSRSCYVNRTTSRCFNPICKINLCLIKGLVSFTEQLLHFIFLFFQLFDFIFSTISYSVTFVSKEKTS